MKRIVFTVTNELSYDQRMQRICSSLARESYDVLLIGRKRPNAIPLQPQPFRQKRLTCWFQRGPLFYLEYNCRLFFYLLFIRTDIICAIDLDTILPCYFASAIRRKKRVYDAHELFTEMKEIVARPGIRKIWMAIERFAVPRFPAGYTVNQSLVTELHRRYGVTYQVIRNLPVLTPITSDIELSGEPFVIYQGAVNEGRSFETIIPAMRQVEGRLLICGEGNFFEQTKALIRQYGVEDKVELKGYVPPHQLKQLTPRAKAALMIFESTGINQYHSLSNRFFDYIMAGVPQVCVNYPEYKAINDDFQVALMIDDTTPDTIANAINHLLHDQALHTTLRDQCFKARQVLNWNSEEQALISFYRRLTSA